MGKHNQCVCICFVISPTPPRNLEADLSRERLSILFLSIFFPLILPSFFSPECTSKMVLSPLLSSSHLLVSFFTFYHSLFPSPWCLWPVLIYAGRSYSNCHPSALWDRHATCGAPRPNVITFSVCLSVTHTHAHSTRLFLCYTAAQHSDLCRLLPQKWQRCSA